MKAILSVLLVAMMTLPAFSQGYEPRETWPFLYETFQPGAARTRDGSLSTEARFNVALHDGSLMYVSEDGIIMRADMNKIYTAKVGDDVYLNAGGRMYKVLSELDCGVVLQGAEIDVDKQNTVKIGYGISSSTASAQGVSLLMDGRFDTVNKSLQQTELDKFRGEVLPVKETLWLRIGIQMIAASRQEILNLPGIDKKAANAFFKQEKIKWRETASLEKLLVFVNEQLNQ